jgi:diguanylate cyclase (GGDEF)-like protein
MWRRLLDENLALRRVVRELRVLRRLAHLDVLTGLPNRRLAETRLAEELSRARRDPAAFGSFLIIDVNDLKLVNDLRGHGAGDDALRQIAQALKATLRTADVCCRTGGDEFTILLPDTDARGAAHAMARLRSAVMREGARANLPLSISVGSASWPADGRTAAALGSKADAAMYEEKRRHRARGRSRPLGAGKLALVK